MACELSLLVDAGETLAAPGAETGGVAAAAVVVQDGDPVAVVSCAPLSGFGEVCASCASGKDVVFVAMEAAEALAEEVPYQTNHRCPEAVPESELALLDDASNPECSCHLTSIVERRSFGSEGWMWEMGMSHLLLAASEDQKGSD